MSRNLQPCMYQTEAEAAVRDALGHAAVVDSHATITLNGLF